jgi:hypothetical protein
MVHIVHNFLFHFFLLQIEEGNQGKKEGQEENSGEIKKIATKFTEKDNSLIEVFRIKKGFPGIKWKGKSIGTGFSFFSIQGVILVGKTVVNYLVALINLKTFNPLMAVNQFFQGFEIFFPDQFVEQGTDFSVLFGIRVKHFPDFISLGVDGMEMDKMGNNRESEKNNKKS